VDLRQLKLLEVSPDQASAALQGSADKRRRQAVVTEKLQHGEDERDPEQLRGFSSGCKIEEKGDERTQ
jgi:hypothetical protein